jgi:hypothetical protein
MISKAIHGPAAFTAKEPDIWPVEIAVREKFVKAGDPVHTI